MTVNTTIPCERTATTAAERTDAPGRLEDHAGALSVALAIWATRDDSKAQPEVRRAANTAMDGIDAMLAELHQARSRLITEMRQSDDAAMARTEILLSSPRGERP
jgi:hypothetical protein